MSELMSRMREAAKRINEAQFGLLGGACASDCTCNTGDSDDSDDTGSSDDSGDSTDSGDDGRVPVPFCNCPPKVIEATYPRITIAEQGQIARIPGIAVRLATCEGKIGTLESDISTARHECEAEHETMEAGIASNAKAISDEKTRAEESERVLTDKVNGKVDTETFVALETKVNEEITNRGTSVTGLVARVEGVETALASEQTKRETADKAIRTDVSLTVDGVYSTLRGEASALKVNLEEQIATAKSDAYDKVTAEEAERKAEDAALTVKMNDAVSSLKAKDTELATLVGETKAEVTSGYRTADEAIQTQVTANANTIAANRTLFDNAKTTFEGNVATLASKLEAEVSDRKNGDTSTLQSAKDYAKSLLSSALRYQGQVATLSELDAKTATAIKGDMWNVLNDGDGLASNYAFNGIGWDRLTESIDLSPYAKVVDVEAEVATLSAKDAEIEGKVSANTEKINADVAAEKSRATIAETTLQSNISAEETARIAKDSSLESSVNGLTEKLATEATRLENLIASTASTKELDAISRENAIKSGLETADANLLAKVNALSETVANNKTEAENSLLREETDRKNAVTELKNELTVTSVDGSSRLVGMGEVLSKIGGKQDLLQSGINVKTINGESVLGSGDIEIKAKTAFEVVLDPTTMSFDVTAEELKAAIDEGEEIVIHEDGAVRTVTYRKCLVKNNVNTVTLYAHSGNDGLAKMVVVTIEKVSGEWQYSGGITADSEAEKVKRSGDTMLGDLSFEYEGDSENKGVVSNAGLSLTKTVGAYTTGTKYGVGAIKFTASDGTEYAQTLPSESGEFVVNEKDPVFEAWKNGTRIALGRGAGFDDDSDSFATAIGASSIAGPFAVAIGKDAEAKDTDGVAIGDNAKARNYYTVALGVNSLALQKYSIAIGPATARGESSIAIGKDATALSGYSVAIGYGTSATARSVAIGNRRVSGGYAGAVSNTGNSMAIAYYPSEFWFGAYKDSTDAKSMQSYLDEKANATDVTSLGERVEALEAMFAAVSEGKALKIKSEDGLKTFTLGTAKNASTGEYSLVIKEYVEGA